MSELAFVAIGRNEGARLRRCLESLQALGPGTPVVYVDSGSTDGSPALARSMGAVVVELDPSSPFTAARGRNAGLEEVLARFPEVELVQFVDGDCELVRGWLEEGRSTLRENPRIAAVCGRVSELAPGASVYNRLCELEWAAPPGDARACGGNALMRVAALREVGGFNPALIGGEEPELCLRLRRRGWRIWRSPADMVRHDAGMTRFGQFWRRSLRSGWTYAELSELHRGSSEPSWRHENRSILFWGAALPLAISLVAAITDGLGLVLLAGYPVLAVRIYLAERRAGRAAPDARLRALFLVIAKFSQVLGLLEFRLKRRRPVIDWRGSA